VVGSRGALCGVVVRPAIIVRGRWTGPTEHLDVAWGRGSADRVDVLSHPQRGSHGKRFPGLPGIPTRGGVTGKRVSRESRNRKISLSPVFGLVTWSASYAPFFF
jgi:hypothetical protein